MPKFTGLQEFGKAFIPRGIRPGLRRHLLKAGYTEVPYTLFGGLFVLSIILSALLYILFVFPLLGGQSQFLFMILTFVFWAIIQSLVLLLIIMLVYVHLDLKIFKRMREMEDVLEEFLRYVSENLKGGMPFDRALWEAIRPRYGTLADEISLVAKRVMTGRDIADALRDFTDKYNSPMLKRSFQLIIEGMKGGGNIAYIIDRVEKNIRETKELKDEISAANTTYVIFMASIVLVIAPALFGLSYNLLLVLKSIAGKIAQSGGGTTSSMLDFSNISIEPETFKTFSMGALGIISLFSSMIMSIIQKGNIKEGLKYIPVFIVISLIMYVVFREILYLVFSGMMGI